MSTSDNFAPNIPSSIGLSLLVGLYAAYLIWSWLEFRHQICQLKVETWIPSGYIRFLFELISIHFKVLITRGFHIRWRVNMRYDLLVSNYSENSLSYKVIIQIKTKHKLLENNISSKDRGLPVTWVDSTASHFTLILPERANSKYLERI